MRRPQPPLRQWLQEILSEHTRHCVDDPCDCGYTADGSYVAHLADVLAQALDEPKCDHQWDVNGLACGRPPEHEGWHAGFDPATGQTGTWSG